MLNILLIAPDVQKNSEIHSAILTLPYAAIFVQMKGLADSHQENLLVLREKS
jgi:hypothetical protein